MAVLRVKRADGTWAEIPALVGPKGDPGPISDPIRYTTTDRVYNQQSVRVVDESGASVDVDDNAAYFDAEYLVVDRDTYKLGKEAMLSIPDKHMVGNGSVEWNGWDTLVSGIQQNELKDRLNSKLKARYSDDPIYLAMKLPSEAETDKLITKVVRPLMSPLGNSNVYNMLVNMGGIYAPEPEKLPDEIVICIGRLALYTLSNDANAKWELHSYDAVPSGYAMYYLPWSSMGDDAQTISPEKIEVHDNYVRFRLTREDFSPDAVHPDSIGKVLHFWDEHSRSVDLSNHAAHIAMHEVWTETEAAQGLLYSAIGVDQKSTTSSVIKQCISSRWITVTTKKRVAIGHYIADATYDELRDTPNDPRTVYADYASVNSYMRQTEVDTIRKDLDLNIKRTSVCFETVIPIETVKVGVNLNDGVWEYGYFDESGNPASGVEGTSVRNVNYLPVDGGRGVVIYYDSAIWNKYNQGWGAYLVQYGLTKNIIRRDMVHTYVADRTPIVLEDDTRYIRVSFNKWEEQLGCEPSEIKIAVYYKENARMEFVEYDADSEIMYGVDGGAVCIVSPNGTRFALVVNDDGTLSTRVIT